MKTICLSQTRCLTAVSLMLVGVLLTCYGVIVNLRHGGIQDIENVADVVPAEEDGDAEYLEKRHEFLDRFFGTGPGGVSPSAYMAALAAARSLPPSPLLQGGKFVSPEAPEVTSPWTSPIAPPMQNSYGGNASARVHALAIDPVNANVVYTGTFGGLAKTTDGGVTWRYLSDSWASQSVSAIAVNPGASNDVYVGTGREGSGAASYEVGLYRSFDGGSTWSSALGKAQFEGTYIRTIAIDPNTSSSQLTTTVYAANGGTNTCGLWRSTDSGVTWLQLYQVDNGVYDVAIDAATHPSTLYITEENGTLKSTDSGRSWTLIHSVLEHSRNRLSVANSTLYLLGPSDPDHNLYKSMDGGATWIQIPTRCPCAPDVCANDNPPGPPICADSCASRCGNIGFSVFAVDPVDPQIILGGNQALYRPDNEGATWTEIGNKWGGDSAHNLIDPVDGTVGYFTMYRDYVFRRFNTATPHTSVNVRPSQFDDDASCNFFPTFSMNPSSPTHIIAACQQVVRTLDGPTVTPESWTTIGQPFADPVTATYEAPNNSNVIYAVAAHGEVWMTTNANAGTAAVWRNVTRDLPGGIWTIAVHPTDPQTAYLACDSGMYKTTDMGTTWMQQGVQNLIYRDVAIDPLNPQHIFAASNAGVFASTDGGLSWGNMSDGIPAGLVVTALSFNASSRQLAASTFGRGVYMLHLDPPPRPRPTPRPRP